MKPMVSLHLDISVMDCGLTDFKCHSTECSFFFLGSVSHLKRWCEAREWVVERGARGGGNIIQNSIQLATLC